VAQVLGLSSQAAETTLEHGAGDAVVHRDHLVLTSAAAARG
jgi:acetyl-CoA carboxylase beta subunit